MSSLCGQYVKVILYSAKLRSSYITDLAELALFLFSHDIAEQTYWFRTNFSGLIFYT